MSYPFQVGLRFINLRQVIYFRIPTWVSFHNLNRCSKRSLGLFLVQWDSAVVDLHILKGGVRYFLQFDVDRNFFW